MKYHTALKPTEDYPESEGFQIGKSLAFAYDLEASNDLPTVYNYCDILYTEIPWRDGYTKFNERAGVKGSDYDSFLARISHIINTTQKHFVIICGKKIIGKLPKPSNALDVDLNGYPSKALLYGVDPEGLNTSNFITLLQSLSQRYNKIGDFCCGYGNTGKVFRENSKEFVMSDVNKKCIGYIQANVKGWNATV